MEVWKTIEGFENYQVSNLGNVKSLNYNKTGKEKLLKPNNSKGYLKVVLSVKGKRKTIKIHRLVVIAFINYNSNDNELVVNHKNFKRNDNRLENLEIISIRENTNKKHLKSTSKYVGVFWHKKNKKWISKITINRDRKYLGSFINEIDAHNAYQNELIQIKNHQ